METWFSGFCMVECARTWRRSPLERLIALLHSAVASFIYRAVGLHACSPVTSTLHNCLLKKGLFMPRNLARNHSERGNAEEHSSNWFTLNQSISIEIMHNWPSDELCQKLVLRVRKSSSMEKLQVFGWGHSPDWGWNQFLSQSVVHPWFRWGHRNSKGLRQLKYLLCVSKNTSRPN